MLPNGRMFRRHVDILKQVHARNKELMSVKLILAKPTQKLDEPEVTPLESTNPI